MIHLSVPVVIDLYVDNVLQVSANKRSLLHYEKDRDQSSGSVKSIDQKQDRHKGKEVVDYGEDGLAIYADGTREEKGEFAAVEADGVEVGDSFNGMMLM